MAGVLVGGLSQSDAVQVAVRAASLSLFTSQQGTLEELHYVSTFPCR